MQASAVIPGGQRNSVTVDLSRQPKNTQTNTFENRSDFIKLMNRFR
jgi:hypothetical protein